MDNPDPSDKYPSGHLVSPDPDPLDHPLYSKGSFAGDMAKLFDVTGGSILYCISAVLVAYGIVNILGPILTKDSFWDAFPCILTLQVYEIALLGVLVLIVAKKVIDDAISVTVLIALYLIGTSIAFGSVADRAIHASFIIAVFSIILALGKFYILRRFAGLSLGCVSLIGLTGVVAFNYLGPVLLARSIAIDASAEATRRSLWFVILLGLLFSSACVLISMVRRKVSLLQPQSDATPFLHTPSMVILVTCVLLVSSGVHLYAMAFACALERAMADFIPIAIVVCLLLLELLRHIHKRNDYWDIAVACFPLIGIILAIQQKSVLSGTYAGWEALGYPPSQFALGGLAIAGLAWFRKQKSLWYAVAVYGLGIVLTLGFSPNNPYALNYRACTWAIMVGLAVYGLFKGKPVFCIVAIILLCVELEVWGSLPTLRKACNVTQLGSLAGVFGLSSLALYIIYGKKLPQAVGWLAAISFAVFVFDYLPGTVHSRYLVVCPSVSLVILALWLRLRDVRAMAILGTPLAMRLYMVARLLGHWRFVILGFLVLGGGTLVSLLKRRIHDIKTGGCLRK